LASIAAADIDRGDFTVVAPPRAKDDDEDDGEEDESGTPRAERRDARFASFSASSASHARIWAESASALAAISCSSAGALVPVVWGTRELPNWRCHDETADVAVSASPFS
jgi:hypothetical protein